MKIALTLRCT